jgi:hypothetical protein
MGDLGLVLHNMLPYTAVRPSMGEQKIQCNVFLLFRWSNATYKSMLEVSVRSIFREYYSTAAPQPQNKHKTGIYPIMEMEYEQNRINYDWKDDVYSLLVCRFSFLLSGERQGVTCFTFSTGSEWIVLLELWIALVSMKWKLDVWAFKWPLGA